MSHLSNIKGVLTRVEMEKPWSAQPNRFVLPQTRLVWAALVQLDSDRRLLAAELVAAQKEIERLQMELLGHCVITNELHEFIGG